MYQNITSFEAACAARGIDPAKLPIVSEIPERHQGALITMFKLYIITEAINNDVPGEADWEADFNDEDQYKYYPWFEGGRPDGSGSGFSFHATFFGWSFTAAPGGARLCFKDRERAKFAGETFTDLYKEIYLILNSQTK